VGTALAGGGCRGDQNSGLGEGVKGEPEVTGGGGKRAAVGTVKGKSTVVKRI